MRSIRCAGTLALLATLGLAAPASSQILDTLRGFAKPEPGWSGGVGASFGATGGNTENVSLGGSGHLQWQGEVNRWRLLLDGSLEETREERTEEASAVHLRHNRRLSDRFATLAFVQHQHDRFQRVGSRFLVGAGLRWDLLRSERLEASWGASPMLEVERVTGEDTDARGRLSTFVSVLGKLDARSSVDLSTFIQPALDEPSDVRAVGSGTLRVELTGGLALVVGGRVQYDADPAPGVKGTDWKTRTGLTMSF